MLLRCMLALISVITMVIAPYHHLPARAHEEPPFEIVFPQEVAPTTLHNDWRASRSAGRRHEGNDLMAPKMTEVYAAADGRVVKVSTSTRAGRYLIIEHGSGWETYYIHLNNDHPGSDDGAAPWYLTIAPGVFEGATVAAGQLIGWVGDSGNAERAGSHTHFELHYDGIPINPYHALVEAMDRQRSVNQMLEDLVDPPVEEGNYRV